MNGKPRIAAIGAGMAGLSLARHLGGVAEVIVLEKSSRPGGRLATRRGTAWQFDHGAQYFTARDPRFQAWLQPLLAKGTVTEWRPNITTLSPNGKPYKRDWFEPHYVAHGAMAELGMTMAEGLNVRYASRVSALARDIDRWWLEVEASKPLGPFDWVLVAIPAPQALALLPTSFTGTTALTKVQMNGCYTLMLALKEDPGWPFDCAVVKESALSWLALDHRKPGRPRAPALLVHSSNAWAEARLEADAESVMDAMLAALGAILPGGTPDFVERQLHRWRYADVSHPLGVDHWLDGESRLGVCGDWCIGGRVEAAFISGLQLAAGLLARV